MGGGGTSLAHQIVDVLGLEADGEASDDHRAGRDARERGQLVVLEAVPAARATAADPGRWPWPAGCGWVSRRTARARAGPRRATLRGCLGRRRRRSVKQQEEQPITITMAMREDAWRERRGGDGKGTPLGRLHARGREGAAAVHCEGGGAPHVRRKVGVRLVTARRCEEGEGRGGERKGGEGRGREEGRRGEVRRGEGGGGEKRGVCQASPLRALPPARAGPPSRAPPSPGHTPQL